MASGALWPEANAKWTQNMDPTTHQSLAAGLMGCDGTGSIDLGNGRVLWPTGDALWATAAGQTRSQCAHPRNAVSLQSGSYDFSACTLTSYAGAGGTSFFPERAPGGCPCWHWPGVGVMLDDKLLVSSYRMESAAGGFRQRGTTIWLVDNPAATPSSWVMTPIDLPDGQDSIMLTGQLIDGGDGWLYVVGQTDLPERAGYLARFPRAAAKRGEFGNPQWWMGTVHGFDYGRPRRLASTFPIAQILPPNILRVSVTAAKRSADWIAVGSVGFPQSDVRYGSAATLEGPFPDPLTSVFTPPENATVDGSGHRLYATYGGSGHVEQTWADKGANDVLLAYAASQNGSFSNILLVSDIYWPRLVKGIDLVAPPAPQLPPPGDNPTPWAKGDLTADELALMMPFYA